VSLRVLILICKKYYWLLLIIKATSMKIQITPPLISFLITAGYRYCYSRTTCTQTNGTDICITLTPVKSAPRLRSLPVAYDTYFLMKEEPLLMARGMDDDTAVVIDTTGGELKGLGRFFNKKFGCKIWKD
jgi:hypothetical protein